METAHIQCSECHQTIGVQRDDLGHYVRCPLCQKVILAQAADTSGAEGQVENLSPQDEEGQVENLSPQDEEGQVENLSPQDEEEFRSSASEADSIFGPTEAETEDIFGSPPPRKLNIPIDEAPTDIQEAPNLSLVEEQQPVHESDEETPRTEPHPSAPEPMDGPEVKFHDEDTLADHEWMGEEHQHAASAARVSVADSEAVRRTRASGMIAVILLIFFIPYSIFTTAAIAWLMVTRETYTKDPLERMLEDNRGGKKEILRIKHDEHVPGKLRTSLGKPFQIGAVEIQPLKVTMNKEGDLALHMQLRNISSDLKFNPLPIEFAEYDPRAKKGFKTFPPYIFLETDVEKGEPRSRPVYGGSIQWFRGSNGNLEQVLNADLLPGESMIAVLETFPDADAKKRLQALFRDKMPLLWRVHLRRGLEMIAGEERVITCVVGVEFRLEDIEKS